MTRKYTQISNYKRQDLIDKIQKGMSIKNASLVTGVPYENAKAIYRVFKSEMRVDKRKIRQRSRMKVTKNKE